MNEKQLDLLRAVMAEHTPQWVFGGAVETRVICSCGGRVKYADHVSELMRERMEAEKKKEETTDENRNV